MVKPSDSMSGSVLECIALTEEFPSLASPYLKDNTEPTSPLELFSGVLNCVCSDECVSSLANLVDANVKAAVFGLFTRNSRIPAATFNLSP